MKQLPLREYVLTWLALLVLLGLSAGSSLISLGVFNVISNFAIAIVKAGLVLLVFMRIRQSAPVVRIVAASGLVWLSLLIGLGLGDFLARGVG